MRNFENHQLAILEKIAGGVCLGAILKDIILAVDGQSNRTRSTLFLYNPEDQTLCGGVSSRVPQTYLDLVNGSQVGDCRGSCGTAVFRKEVIVVEDISTHPYWDSYRDCALAVGLRACWSTPILSTHGEVLGTFAIYYDEPGLPTAQEQNWVARATHLAAITLERDRNVRALQESQARAKRQARLYTVSSRVNELMARRGHPADMMEAVCRIPVEENLAALVWLGSYNQEVDQFLVRSSHGRNRGYLEAIKLSLQDPRIGRGPAGEALRSGRPSLVADIASDERFFYQELALENDLHCCLALPLTFGGEDEGGVLVLYGDHPGAFTEEDVAVMSGVANNLSFVLELTKQELERRELEQRTSFLQTLSEALSQARGPEEVMKVAVDRLGEFLDVSRCNYGLVGADEASLFIPHNYCDNCSPVVGHLRLSDFATELADLLRQGTVVINDTLMEGHRDLGLAALGSLEVRAFVSCSLIREGRMKALLSVQQTSPRIWTDGETSLVAEVADRCWAFIQQKRAESKLRQNDELLRIVGNAAKIGGWSMEPPDYRLLWSEELRQILEMPPESQLPAPREVLDLFSGEYRDLVKSAVQTCIDEGRAFDLEALVTTYQQQPLWVRVMGEPETDSEGRVVRVQGALQDVQQRHQLEHQLRETQKLEAVGQLAGGVAHDFNNLLTVILSCASLAIDSLSPEDEVLEELKEITGAGQRAAELTRQLLTFSRRQVRRPQVLDINESLRGLQKMLVRLVGEHIRIDWHLSAQPCTVFADPGQLEQVVVNLIVNARDALGHEGGRITVETGRTRTPHSPSPRHQSNHSVRLNVSDDGCGMPEKVRSRIFEPFFTTKETGKGTGLGLATVWGIVTQSEGSIEVASKMGEGSTFSVCLPLAEGPVEAARQPAQTQTMQGNETILLVEDEAKVRSVLHATLRNHGYRVLEAQNGGEAFLICERYQGEIQLMITDVVMPIVSGVELAARIAELRPDMEVLYISGYAENHLSDFREHFWFLPKPITPDTLLAKIRKILGSVAPFPSVG